MFDDYNIVTNRKLNLLEKKTVEENLKRQINADEITIFKRNFKRRLH